MTDNLMKRRDVLRMCSISSTGFTKLVALGIIQRDDNTGMYSVPWNVTRMFKTSDVAGFLTLANRRMWTIDQVLYIHRDMFFDLHMNKCNRPMLRITDHDFRSLVKSTNESYVKWFDKHYDYKSG